MNKETDPFGFSEGCKNSFGADPSGNGYLWPAPGSEDTELGVFMGPEVSHGERKAYAGVQA